MGQRNKANLYSEEFQAMLDRLEEEDYAEKGTNTGVLCTRPKSSRLCIQQVKALEKHFEADNKLQPERKVKIAEELGLEPRQVAIWFQNRRARSKAKQLEKEYDELRASYDALKHDYGSLEQEKKALLSQLKDVKAKIEARTLESSTSRSIPATLSSIDALYESTPVNVELPSSSSSSISCVTTFDPFPIAPSSTCDGYEIWKAYQSQLVRMEELGLFTNNEDSCNFFSVDQAPTLRWHHGDQSS